MSEKLEPASDEPEMKTIRWELSIGLVGCRVRGTIEMESDASDDEIEEAVRDAVMERCEWTWSWE